MIFRTGVVIGSRPFQERRHAMPVIDSRLIDGFGEAEHAENYNRVLSIVDANKTSAETNLSDAVSFATPVNAVAAKVTLTIATLPTADDTFTIGTKVYTFKATAEADGDIAIGADVAATRLNTVAAINGTGEGQVCTAHPDVTCAAFSSANAVITAKVNGTAGNDIASTETFTAEGNVFSAETLTTGVDGTVASKGAIRVDASKIYVATDDNTVADANWKSAALS